MNPCENSLTHEIFDFGGVNIIMIGPTSETGNIVTPMEANRLYMCLKRYFEGWLWFDPKVNFFWIFNCGLNCDLIFWSKNHGFPHQ